MSRLPPSPSSTLPGFSTLSSQIFLYTPTPAKASPLTSPPSSPPKSKHAAPALIILSTWFAAQPRHILKYTSKYQTLYPTSSIMVLTGSTPDFLYRSYSTQQLNMKPALAVIQDLFSHPPVHNTSIEEQKHETKDQNGQAKKEILLHILSNAGAHTFCQLLHLHSRTLSLPLPISAIILDSSPGSSSITDSVAGWSGGLPSTPIIRQLLTLIMYGTVTALSAKYWITGDKHFVDRARADLLDGRLVQVGERGWVYLFGGRDEVVRRGDVERHAAMVRERGRVRMVYWRELGHVQGAARMGEEYWRVVGEVWDGREEVCGESAIKMKSKL